MSTVCVPCFTIDVEKLESVLVRYLIRAPGVH